MKKILIIALIMLITSFIYCWQSVGFKINDYYLIKDYQLPAWGYSYSVINLTGNGRFDRKDEDGKWVDEYYWEAVFASGPVPAYNSLDLQLNYSFPSLYSIFRIGGSNILGTEYIQAYAMPQIGAFYYASWTFNVDFKK